MSASRDKGTRAESAVVAYLQGAGFMHAERRALRGSQDRGDVAGIPDAVIEVKNTVRLELAQWLKEAEQERVNGDARWGVIWAKRRGKASPADWYVVMNGSTFVDLLKDALGVQR